MHIGELSGEVLAGRYELRALLGRGGFGAVYNAWDRQRQLSRAIKILYRDRFADPHMRDRFMREAQILAQLDHPHIVSIDDFGIDAPRQRAYLVMPYINGGTIQDLLPPQQGLLDPDEVLDLLGQLCGALDYVHARQIVHLDLKPQNILCTRLRDLLLADFGLAHWLIAGRVRGGSSMRMGTPYYMAPEHLEGKPERLSDIYAVGVILYHLLAGRVPFEGTPFQVLMAHQLKSPPSLVAVRPELPPTIDEVVQVALAKRPEDRFATAGALLAAATDALRPPAPRLRAAQWSLRLSTPAAPFAPTQQVQHPPVTELAASETLAAPQHTGRTSLWQTVPVWILALSWLQYVMPMAARFLLPAVLALLAHAGFQWSFWSLILPVLRGQSFAPQAVTSAWVGLGVGAICGLLAVVAAREVRSGYGFAEETPAWRYLNYVSSVLGWVSGGGLALVVGHAVGTWFRLLESEWVLAAADAVFLGLGTFAFIQHDPATAYIETVVGGAILAVAWVYYRFWERGWWL